MKERRSQHTNCAIDDKNIDQKMKKEHHGLDLALHCFVSYCITNVLGLHDMVYINWMNLTKW
jgi:hypothetical protein